MPTSAAPTRELYRPLIGNSERMELLRRHIEKAAKTRWPVLILGETGTGKELVARAIHAGAKSGPFVTVDCSSLVGPLMESELFGHTKGAFTGAAATKLGMLEMADGGTAFLDEIGELPLEMQMKLLRALQEKEFRPVGSLTQRRSDFRVIAATNRDIAEEVARGTFRRDLYYRLNVVTVRLRPLRDRREDIPLLVEHFLDRIGASHVVTPEAMDAMMSYNWPGNVRELENLIQQMVAMNSGPLLHLYDLPTQLQNHLAGISGKGIAASAAGTVQDHQPGTSATQPQIVPLPELEKRAIFEALQYTKGDRTWAATLLGIGRTTLYRKLREYSLERSQPAVDRMADCESPSMPATASDPNCPE